MQSVAASSLRAQDPKPPVPPGSRVTAPPQGDEIVLDEAVQKMQGKPVRSVTFLKTDPRGSELAPLDPAAAESLVRSLQTRVAMPFEARKISGDCTSLWGERRVVVQAFANEVDGEIAVTFVVTREVDVYAGVEFVGLQSMDRFTVDGLLSIYPDRQITRTEAEAMRKTLLARYRRDGFAHCDVAVFLGCAIESHLRGDPVLRLGFLHGVTPTARGTHHRIFGYGNAQHHGFKAICPTPFGGPKNARGIGIAAH